MNSIVGFFVGILQAAFSIFAGVPTTAPIPTDTNYGALPPQQTTMSPQDVVAQYGSLPHGLPDSSQSTTGTQAASDSAASVSGMTKYTDPDFGFSFWTPKDWLIKPSSVQSPHDYSDGTIVKQLFMGKSASYDVGIVPPSIFIYEVASNGRSITFGDTHGLIKHYFDPSTHTWMTARSVGTDVSLAQWNAAPADVSLNTMGGLHMLSGPSAYVPYVVPLSASHFLVIEGPGANSPLTKAFIETILATDPAVATPVSIAEQNAAIQAEAQAYGISTSPSNVSASLKTYTDAQNGFSIKYSSTLALKTSGLAPDNSYSTAQATDPTAQNLLAISSGPEKLSIGVSPDPTDVGNCMVSPQRGETSASNATKVNINGVSFLKYSSGSVGMGQYEGDVIYHTLRNNACWTLDIQTQGEEDNRLNATEASTQDNAIAAASALLDPVVQSFTFISDTSNAAPPTCSVLTNKPAYLLGDVIKLTWTSGGATKALWYQPAEQGSGLRKLIVPPKDVPAISGSASTVANVEGYQPITMQVTGPGGFGTCTTEVEVTHSAALPSITIVSGSISGTGSGGPNVTINGTATNGALLNDGVNLVLIDPTYTGPFDEASIYSAGWKRDNGGPVYSGGNILDLRTDSLPFENWTVPSYGPAGITSVRVLAYPFYSSSIRTPTQPLANVVLNLAQ